MMEFSWLSFGFAVINFLVLAVLLWKFLHKPLLTALENRRTEIEGQREAARKQKEEADQMCRDYESKLSGIEDERNQALAEARKQSEEARERLLEKATADAERETAAMRQACDRDRGEAVKEMQREIVASSIEVASNVLSKLSDANIETRLVSQLLAELETMRGTSSAHSSSGGEKVPVRVTSARELSDADKAKFTTAIRNVAGADAEVDFTADEALIAGARVEFSATAVDATLSDLLSVVAGKVAEDVKAA